MEKSRKKILTIFNVAPVFMERDAVEIQILCWLWLAGIPQHHKSIEVSASELNKKKAMDSLFKEGLIGHRAKIFKLTKRGIELTESFQNFPENA